MEKIIQHGKKANIVLVLLALIATAFMINIQNVHAESNRIFFQPAKPIREVGASFSVAIMVEVTNFRNIKFSISWNPGFMDCTGVVKGTLLGTNQIFKPGEINNTLGTVEDIWAAWTLGRGKNGTGSIAVASFKVLKIGGTPFWVSKLEGKDADGDPMTYTKESGYVTIIKTLTQHINWTDPDTGDFHEFNMTTKSNSTVGAVNFDQPNKLINFTVTGPDGSRGFCNATIPRNILDCPELNGLGLWQIFLNSTEISDSCIKTRDNYTTIIHIPYSHSNQTVTVRGTWVVSEFPPNLILPIILLASLAIIPLIRKKQKRP